MKRHSSHPFFYQLALLGVMAVAFLGGMIGIMNFHSDVDMPSTHQVIYRAVTGNDSQNPLAVSIPYSIGLGVGFWILLPGKEDDKKQEGGQGEDGA